MDSDTGGETIQAGLRLALRAAMKAKDAAAVSALRSVLAAIGNAEAVPVPAGTAPGAAPGASQHVAGSAVGVAAAEAARRILAKEETAAIVRTEVADREAAARQYEATGHHERATRLRREAQAIRSAFEPP